MLLWTGFGLALVLLLIVSRRDLALGMLVASVVLAAFTLDFRGFVEALRVTFSDPSVCLLAWVVGLIPMIGGVMEVSGQMGRLVANLRMGIRPFLAIAPALLGMLPMPGGTLLSAPMIERGAGHMDSDLKAAANVWFRHTFLPIYPVGSALIASAKFASMSVYQVIPALVPAFLLTLVLGYIFLLRRADGTLSQRGRFSLAGLLVPLSIILAAPAIDVLLKSVVALPVAEIGTAAGVMVSLALAISIGRTPLRALGAVARKMKPWKYALIILAMFLFLNVFKASGAPETIAALQLPAVFLMVVVGFLLGLITGRVQAPMSILVPIYLTTHRGMTPAVFAVAYFAVFMGFMISPIHPCVSASLEYFGTPLTAFLRRMAWPVAAAVVVTLGVGFLVL